MIKQEFWQTHFWSKARSFKIIRALGAIYRGTLRLKHYLLSNFLCPYYAFNAKYKKTKKEPYDFGELYISLTSYPVRIKTAYYTICSLLTQTFPANRIILTLTEQEFPHLEENLPKEILDMRAKGIEILWASDNLKPHNKYFYSMQKYPKATIITADDDILYPKNTIKKLIESYRRHPNAVHGLCTDKLSNNNSTIPYSKAVKCYDTCILEPRNDLMIEGFAGALYPPNSLPIQAFNATLIKKCSLNADDLWLKYMELIKGTPVVCAAKYKDPIVISKVQGTALNQTNSILGQNDIQQANIIKEFSYFDFAKAILTEIS